MASTQALELARSLPVRCYQCFCTLFGAESDTRQVQNSQSVVSQDKSEWTCNRIAVVLQ
jgi:hypothetical protein